MLVSTEDYELVALHDLVDLFANEMKERLTFMFEKGATGWDSINESYDYEGRIRYHLDRGHLVDAANLIALKWNKKEK